jgi:hypothetical protein
MAADTRITFGELINKQYPDVEAVWALKIAAYSQMSAIRNHSLGASLNQIRLASDRHSIGP